MTNKVPKSAYQILLGFLMLSFTVVACNNNKEGDKKEPAPDTPTVVKPVETAPMDSTKKDSLSERPVKDPG